MRLRIDGPDFDKMIDEDIRRMERAHTRAMDEVAKEIKEAWRGDIRAAGLGNAVANAVRSRRYPTDTYSANPAVMVWTNADKILQSFEEGVTIRARDGFYLAIPLPAAGTGKRGARITPSEWERRRGLKLRFVHRKGLPSLLVADGRQNKKGLAVESRSKTGRNRATVPVFVLLPQVKLRKRLNLLDRAEEVTATIGAKIDGHWD